MTSSEIIRIIHKIEDEFDVWSIKYGDLAIWPLLRTELFSHYFWDYKPPSPISFTDNAHLSLLQKSKRFVADFYWFFKIFIRDYKSFNAKVNKDKSHSVKALSKVDFILYGISSNRSMKVDNRYFNRVIDSFQFFLSKKGSILQLESVINEFLQPRYHSSFLIDILFIKEELYRKLQNKFSNKKYELTNIESFINYLNKTGIDHAFYKSNLVIRLEKVMAYSHAFKKVLIKTQPKCLFLDIYYYDKAMAAIYAAKQLNIPSVDIQHGVQGKNHLAYSVYSNLPPEGSLLLPDFFWVWDKGSYDNIKNWTEKRNDLTPILGGNPLIASFKQKFFNINLPEELVLKLKSFDCRVLITLAETFETEQGYLRIIKDIISEFPKNIFWIFRYHPECIERNTVFFNQLFENSGHDNVSSHSPHEVGLYPLFNYIDLHITTVSTVCLEAESFNIKNIILGKEGRKHYNDSIESGIFQYAEPENLRSILMKNIGRDDLNKDKTEKNHYLNDNQIDNILSIYKKKQQRTK